MLFDPDFDSDGDSEIDEDLDFPCPSLKKKWAQSQKMVQWAWESKTEVLVHR